MIEQVLKDIEELMAREELRQAWKVFVRAWNLETKWNESLWSLGYQIALLSDDKTIMNSFIHGCRLVLEGSPRDAHLLQQLATLCDTMERFDESLPIYRSMLRMRLSAGERRNTEYSMATIFLAIGRLQEARAILSSAIGRIRHERPIFTPYYGLMGEIEGKLGRWREATSWYDKAIRYDPSETSWPRQCATLLEKQGQHAEALRYWDLVLAIPREAIKQAVCDSRRGYWKTGEYMKSQKLAKKHRAICAARAGSRN